MKGTDGPQGKAHRFARQLGHQDGDGKGLAARLQAALARRNADDRQELAGRLAQQQGQVGAKTDGLAARLRTSLGGQPLGSVALCRTHQWEEQQQPPRRLCTVCGLASST